MPGAIKAHNELLGYPNGHNEQPPFPEPIEGNPITHGDLIELSQVLGRRKDEKGDVRCAFDLEKLLKGAKVYVPPTPPKAAKSEEYVRLMKRLREEEAQRAYERMINPLPPQETSQLRFPGTRTYGSTVTSGPVVEDVDEATYADINKQITLIINVLVTVIACSVGIWITAWHWPTPARLGLSMGGSGVVAAAEVAIYFGYIKRMSEAKTKEKRKVESKEVIDTWVIDGSAKRPNAARARDDGLRHRKGKHR